MSTARELTLPRKFIVYTDENKTPKKFMFYQLILFLCRLRSIAAHGDHFVRRLSVVCLFIKTETIALDEIGRNKCSYLLARAHTFFYIK